MVLQEEIGRTKIAEGLTNDQLSHLFEVAEVREYKDGEVIIHVDDPLSDLFVLVRGKAQAIGSFKQEINVVEAGSLMGELAFLDKQGRSATVLSSGESAAIVLSDEAIAKLISVHPEVVAILNRNIALVLCQKLRGSIRMIEALSIAYV